MIQTGNDPMGLVNNMFSQLFGMPAEQLNQLQQVNDSALGQALQSTLAPTAGSSQSSTDTTQGAQAGKAGKSDSGSTSNPVDFIKTISSLFDKGTSAAESAGSDVAAGAGSAMGGFMDFLGSLFGA